MGVLSLPLFIIVKSGKLGEVIRREVSLQSTENIHCAEGIT